MEWYSKELAVTSTDKATKNVPFICQFYLNRNITSTNKTYIQVNKSNNQVISDHTTFLKYPNVEVYEENKNLPNIYYTLKLQKHPTKARFIIVAFNV